MDWLRDGTEPEVHANEALPRPTEAVAQTDQPCSVRLQRSSPGVDRTSVHFSCYTDVQSEDLE